MTRGKAFVVVGHSNWGKSKTLYRLTHDVWQVKWIEIKNIWLYIKRMSNDDIAQGLYDFLDKIEIDVKKNIIITLCPNFTDPDRMTKEILNLLCKKYIPYFFVIKKSYLDNQEITNDEIKEIQKYGKTEILEKKCADEDRAKAFEQFIETNL